MENHIEAKTDCNPCHWVHKMKGGSPLSVAVCSLCGQINWGLLAEDFDRAARQRACEIMQGVYGRHDYPDGSSSLCERGMVNVIQVYSLFSKEPGQDGCDREPLPRRKTAQAISLVIEGVPVYLGPGLPGPDTSLRRVRRDLVVSDPEEQMRRDWGAC